MNLTEKQKQWIAWVAVALVMAIISTFFGVNYPIPEPPIFESPMDDEVIAMGTTHFTNISAEDITATDDLTVTDDASIGDALSVTGATTLASTVTLSDGDLVVADDLRVTAQTAISVTNGAVFTPTGTYQPIKSAGTVTPTVAVGTAGDLLVLINTSNTTINIADSGTMMLSSAVALGQYDSLTLWCDGTNWIEIATSNN